MKRIINQIKNIFSLDTLSADFKKFSFLHFLFVIFISMQAVFINTLLFRLTNDIMTVAIYNAASWITLAVFMNIAVFVVKRTSIRFVLTFSILMYILLYIVLFVFMQDISKYIFLVVLFNSIGGGFYWICFSFAVVKFNTDKSKPIALAWLGAIVTIVNFIIPALSGFIISSFGGLTGYRVVFGLAFSVAILAIIIAISMPKSEVTDKSTRFKQTLKASFKNKILKNIMLGEFMRAMREGAFIFLLNILLFQLIKSEALIGINALLVSAITFIAQWSSGKIAYKYKYSKIIRFSVAALVVSTVLIIFNYSAMTIMILSISNGFFSVYLLNPTLNIFYNGVMKVDVDNNMSFEIFSIREALLALGRIVGIVIVFSLPKTPIGYAIGMIILTLSQLIMSYFMQKAEALIDADE